MKSIDLVKLTALATTLDNETKNILLELISKETPENIIHYTGKVWGWNCPVCNAHIDKLERYCQHCGQRIVFPYVEKKINE